MRALLYSTFSTATIAMIILLILHKNVIAERNTILTENMILVEGGKFLLGSSEKDGKIGMFIGVDELPQQEIELSSFFIDKYEVTNKGYKTFIDTTRHSAPIDKYEGIYSWKDNSPPDGQEELPVTNVNWYDAYEFCRWKGKRLPTEAEWEKAARGNDGRQWPWGNVYRKDSCNTKYSGAGRILPIGTLAGDKSPNGVYDMCGNVSEWTDSWYLPYRGSTLKRDSFGEVYKVARGGSWIMPVVPYSRASYRANNYLPEYKNRGIGFRCALDD